MIGSTGGRRPATSGERLSHRYADGYAELRHGHRHDRAARLDREAAGHHRVPGEFELVDGLGRPVDPALRESA